MIEILGFQCTVLHQKRTTFKISITGSGKITISVPKRATLNQIKAFVKSRETMIRHTLERYRAKRDHDLFGSDTASPFLYYMGRKLPVRFTSTSVGNLKNDCFTLPEGLTTDEYRKIITELYRTAAKEYITPRAEQLSEALGIKYTKLRFAQSTSRWGSRSSSGTISFSVYLIATPPECIDHVIYHEFAHTKEMNHSAKFYDTLASFEPDHRERQEELHRGYGKYLHKFKTNSNVPNEEDRL